MKFQYVIILTGVLFLASNAGCYESGDSVRGSGEVTEVAHDLKGVTGVHLSSSGKLYIEIGDREEIRIVADDNLHEYLITEVDDGILRIGQKSHTNLKPTKTVEFHLTVKKLELIWNSGSGDIKAPQLRAETFEVKETGSGDLDIHELAAGEVNLRLSGSGDVEIDKLSGQSVEVYLSGSGDARVSGGEVDRQDIKVTGSGDYKARGLKSAEAEVRATGSGSVTVHVDDRLQARISGSGDVRYTGKPKVENRESGSGELKQI